MTEFNKRKIVFHVGSVSQIHRVSWEAIEKPTSLNQGMERHLTGIIKLEDTMIFYLITKRSFTILNRHPELRLIMSIRKGLMKDGRAKTDHR